MKTLLIRALTFSRLIDDQHNLSLTNLAMIIVVVKLAIAQQASTIDLGTLLLALSNYNIKKYFAGSTGGTLAQTVQEIKTVIREDSP